MFDAATRGLACHLGVRLGTGPNVPDLGDEGFRLPLAVQIAALITVLRQRDGSSGSSAPDRAALDDPAALSRELLIREVDHWQKMTRRGHDPVRLSTKEMARAVLVATLTRGLPAPAARPLLAELLDGEPQTVLDDHALCYPPSSGDLVLEPLYPDRLGEDFIAAMLPGAPSDEHDTASLDFLADPQSVTILDRLLRPDPMAPMHVTALTMLVETARRRDHVARGYLLPVLRRSPALLVDCGGTAIERAVTIPAIAPALPDLGSQLDRIIGAGTHLSLAVGATAVQERLVRLARDHADPASLAQTLTTLAVRLAAVGRRAEALTTAEEAVTLYRELAGLNRDAYLPDLAMSVNNLAIRLAEAGRRAEALTTAEEAVTLYRELAGLNRDAYLPDLAMSVNNLAVHLAEAGRRAEALTTAQESVRLHEDLVRISPAMYGDRLKQSRLLTQLLMADNETEPSSEERPNT